MQTRWQMVGPKKVGDKVMTQDGAGHAAKKLEIEINFMASDSANHVYVRKTQ